MTRLDFKEEFDAAYILFNTMHHITRNEDLIRFMNNLHKSLRKNGLLIIQVGNMWLYIAGNNFKNELQQANDKKDGIIRHREVRTVIGPYNNIYCHKTNIRYWKDGKELPPKTRNQPTRIFSINEFDLLCRLTKFRILEVFGTTDINEKIEEPDKIRELDKDPEDPLHYIIPVLRKM